MKTQKNEVRNMEADEPSELQRLHHALGNAEQRVLLCDRKIKKLTEERQMLLKELDRASVLLWGHHMDDYFREGFKAGAECGLCKKDDFIERLKRTFKAAHYHYPGDGQDQ
jgi:hypothetical protein